jgi:hypothetical protein
MISLEVGRVLHTKAEHILCRTHSLMISLEGGRDKVHLLLLFITAVPNTKLCAWGEEESGGHVL